MLSSYYLYNLRSISISSSQYTQGDVFLLRIGVPLCIRSEINVPALFAPVKLLQSKSGVHYSPLQSLSESSLTVLSPLSSLYSHPHYPLLSSLLPLLLFFSTASNEHHKILDALIHLLGCFAHFIETQGPHPPRRASHVRLNLIHSSTNSEQSDLSA